MDKTRVSLVLEREHGVLSDPFLAADVPNGVLPGFLEAIADLGKYLAVRSIINDQVCTSISYTVDCTHIQGQPIGRQAG